MKQYILIAARVALGDTLLAKLLGRSVSSVRLYAKGQRPVPSLIARRLEWLQRVAFSLTGGYNSIGTRAWFDRPRVELGQRSLMSLGPDWQPLDNAATKVGRLAATLRGPE